MTSMTPAAAAARSTLYPKLSDAEFAPCADGSIAAGFGADDSAQATRCGLMDLTPLTRTGFRGAQAAAHLAASGFPLAEQPNQASVTGAGELVLRLSQREFWVLGSLQDMGERITGLVAAACPDSGCYPLFCQDSHGWFTLTGDAGSAVMAKLCAVDMRDEFFPPLSIAQTSVARINAIVVKHSINGVPTFSLLFDSGYVSYMWDVLLDAMQEFGGAAVGCSALR